MGDAQPLRPADPRQLGKYRLTGRLGTGGMGIVYAGQTEGVDGRERLVAVKVIHPHLADAPEFRTRFRSEAALAARVARFCTAAVLDVDVDAEQPYLVTEFVDGPTLQEAVEEQGPLSGGALDALAIGIATALMAIHEAGIVHRDLKPGNVILSRFGPRVIDFGIARAADAVTGLTSGVIGSPPYMTPEQFRGETPTGATDVHAWGAVVTFAGTGSPPFGVGPPEVMLYRALQQEAEVDGLEPPLRTLVEAALSKDVAKRPTARAILDALALGPAVNASPAAALAAGVRISDPTAVNQTPTQALSPAEALTDATVDIGARDPSATTTELAVHGPLTALDFGATEARAKPPTGRAAPAGAHPAANTQRPADTQPPADTQRTADRQRPTEAEPAAAAGPLSAEPPGEADAPAVPPRRRRRRVLLPAAVVTALAVFAGALFWAGQNERHQVQRDTPAKAADLTVRQIDADDKAVGPAPAVANAKAGGTVVLYASSGLWNLDPSRNSYTDAMMASSRLLSRTLTAYREDSQGHTTLVGDLATDTGRTSDGGRTWDFTIRPGITFEDGRPVTAADVAYGIARSFQAKLQGAPSYLQQWLTGADASSFRTVYDGKSATALPPGVKVLGEHALRLEFPQAHPDLPAVLSLPNTAAVPRGFQPTDAKPVLATGPYQVAEVSRWTMTIKRNSHWDPATDPLRTAYPDEYLVRFGTAKTDVTNLLIADAEADRTSIQLGTIDPTNAQSMINGGVNSRWIDGVGSHRDLCFNTQRVTDPSVRHALALALNRESVIAALGGAYVANSTASLLSPRVPGYPNAQLQVSRTGDPAAARQELAGKSVTIVLAYRNDKGHEGQRVGAAVKAAFAAAGVAVDLRPLAPDDFDPAIATKSNPYDAYLCSWQPDYPDGEAMLSARFLGSTIRATQNTNTSYLDVPAVDQKLGQLAALRDRKSAASQYVALAQQIQQNYTPVIPIYDQRRLSLRGSAVGGVSFSEVWGVPDLAHVWVNT